MSWPEAAWHIMQVTVCANYLFMPQILYQMAGRSSWVLVFVAALSAFPGAWATYALYARFPTKRLGEYLPEVVGRPMAIVIALFFASYWFGGALIDIVVFAHYVSTTLMHATPMQVLVGVNVLLVLTVGLLGIKTLVRVVDLLLYPIVPFALFVWIWPLFPGELDFSNLFPVRWSDFTEHAFPLGMGLIGMYHGYHGLMLTGPALKGGPKAAAKAMVLGTLAATAAMFAFIAYPLAVFGWPAVTLFSYPGASFIEATAPPTGNFPVRRLDLLTTVFFRFVMMIAAVTYFSLCVHAIADTTEALWPSAGSRARGFIAVLAAVAIQAVSYVFRGLSAVLELVKIWMPLSTVAVLLTAALALAARFRGVKEGAGNGE